ncbi:MAG TPA: hypothetical protein PLY23_09445 [Alphaproteobacteria bacterium]|nr:hypothetical protein [Alphaproteobacteria bacterium]HQS94826.1 hypothetical protein [Alphaproteobacteria bacterium]
MAFFSTKYFVRSHLLLAVLGSVSLFSLESFGMDSDEETSASSSGEVTRSSLTKSIEKFIRYFSSEEEKPLTRDQISGLKFFTTVVHKREQTDLENWLNAMAILVLKGNEGQKTKGLTALIGTLRTTTDKSFRKFDLASFLLEKGSLTASQKKNVYTVLSSVFKSPDEQLQERVQCAAFLFLNDSERAEEKASFLLESTQLPDFFSIQSEFLSAARDIFEKGSTPQKAFGEKLLKALVYKDLKTPKSTESPYRGFYCLDNSLSYWEKDLVWKEYLASLFLSVAQDEHLSLSPKERAEGALKSLKSSWISEIKNRSLSFLWPLIEDPVSLIFDDRVKIATDMYQSVGHDSRSRMNAVWISLLEEFKEPFLDETERKIAERALSLGDQT